MPAIRLSVGARSRASCGRFGDRLAGWLHDNSVRSSAGSWEPAGRCRGRRTVRCRTPGRIRLARNPTEGGSSSLADFNPPDHRFHAAQGRRERKSMGTSPSWCLLGRLGGSGAAANY